MINTTYRHPVLFLTVLTVVNVIAWGPVYANESDEHDETPMTEVHNEMSVGHAMPKMDANRGRKLFVDKGCVACHAINGVGGHDATALDAHTMQPMMNPFDFAAKMWAMAPYMIEAQEEALGEQIQFSGSELADIVAFVHDDKAQHDFGEADLTPSALKMMEHGHGGEETPMKAHGEEIGHMGGDTDDHHDDGQEVEGHTD